MMMKRLAIALALSSAIGCNADADGAKADNTKMNERDRDPTAKTPMDQNQNKGDVDITASIRRAVMADDGLSTNAKNCKIITADGVVTLRGPVATETEKATIAELAEGIDGVKSVDNQLEVAAE
jgi:hyperosmotically inducible protein